MTAGADRRHRRSASSSACSSAAGSTNLAEVRLRWSCAARRGGHRPVRRRRSLLDAGHPVVETLRLPLLATAFALLLVGALGEPRVPGHEPGLRRHPARTRSRSSSTAATCRSGSRASTAAGLDARRRRLAVPHDRPADLDAAFLLRARTARRHHPDPVPVHPATSPRSATCSSAPASRSSCSRRRPRSRPDEEREDSRAPRRLDRPADTGLSRRARAWLALRPPGCRPRATGLVLGCAAAGAGSRHCRPRDRRSGRRHALPTSPRSPAARRRRARPPPSRTSASRSTGRSRRSGPASSSRCSATASTRSRWRRSSSTSPARRRASAFVFVAATLPNLLLRPIAGTFVDRWDHKRGPGRQRHPAGGGRPAHPDRRGRRTSCSSIR